MSTETHYKRQLFVILKLFIIMSFMTKCPKCPNYESKKTTNVYRHLREVHNASEAEVDQFRIQRKEGKSLTTKGSGAWKCPVCELVIPTEKGLKNHMNQKHRKKPIDPSTITLATTSPTMVSPPPKRIQLPKSTEKSLVSSVATVRAQPTQKPGGRYKCPVENCTFFKTRKELALHFSEKHDPGSELETMSFETETEFKIWLTCRQEETCSSMQISLSSHDGNRITHFRLCRHEGSYQSRAKVKNVGESKKKTGDNVCPAFIRTEKHALTGEIGVVGYFSHYGHSLEHARRALSDTETEYLIGLMKEGFNNRQIIRKLDQKYDENSRLGFVLSKDLSYLRKTYCLNEGQLDDDDMKSIRRRVERDDPEDGIYHFSQPDSNGDNFILGTAFTKRQNLKFNIFQCL
nr:protein F56B3.9 [imported] - Caenorhabditis elegans [Caenorhabditis elegans]